MVLDVVDYQPLTPLVCLSVAHFLNTANSEEFKRKKESGIIGKKMCREGKVIRGISSGYLS